MKSLRGRNSNEIFNRKNGLMKITFLGFRKRWGNNSKNGLKSFHNFMEINPVTLLGVNDLQTMTHTQRIYEIYFVVVASRRIVVVVVVEKGRELMR